MFHQDRLRTQIQRFLPLLLALWLVALIPAARTLMSFEWTAGATGLAPTTLPGTTSASGAPLKQESGEALLVVAIHPLCSCTRATLKELEDSVPSWKQPIRATFLIYKSKPRANLPAGNFVSDFDWHRAAYIREARQTLHAEVVEDLNGEQAARLGALTSGEVLLYSAPDHHGSRRLLFSGGVTAGRGMEGENGSIAALEHSINSAGTQTEAHAPVYGCGLATLADSSSKAGPNAAPISGPDSGSGGPVQ